MIKASDVVRMLVPFPSISSDMALFSHMYICIQCGENKQFIKCQKFKPVHYVSSVPPIVYIVEESDISRNPFLLKTTIDCDKAFCISNVIIDLELLTTSRRNVCEELFSDIGTTIQHEHFCHKKMKAEDIVALNGKIHVICSQSK